MRNKKNLYVILTLIVFLIYSTYELLRSQNTPNLVQKLPAPSSVQELQSNRQYAVVTKVIDGDTVEVLIENKPAKIRIIGINTPESVDPRRGVECFGKEAAAVAKKILSGKTVQLESDPTQSERDRYGRLLRYIWIKEGKVDFGKMMIAQGYALEYTYDLPYIYQKEYKEAQMRASDAKKGLWADNAC